MPSRATTNSGGESNGPAVRGFFDHVICSSAQRVPRPRQTGKAPALKPGRSCDNHDGPSGPEIRAANSPPPWIRPPSSATGRCLAATGNSGGATLVTADKALLDAAKKGSFPAMDAAK
jgi:hypothetical protein